MDSVKLVWYPCFVQIIYNRYMVKNHFESQDSPKDYTTRIRQNISRLTEQANWYREEVGKIRAEIIELEANTIISTQEREDILHMQNDTIIELERGLAGIERTIDDLGKTWGLVLKTEQYEEDVIGASSGEGNGPKVN